LAVDQEKDISKFMISFNKPVSGFNELEYIKNVIENQKFSGDGEFNKKCSSWLEKNTGTKKAFLSPSGTHSLEMIAILAGIKPGDEIIMPSFTFSSTANAFILRGAKIVFVDIRPDTMNIDEKKIEAAISPNTKAIVPMHYGGVACEMDTIMQISRKHNLLIIEDAAQCILAKYKGKALGTIGDFGCFSFHESKNIHCGEGGAILINNKNYIKRAEIIREKGTDRSQFMRGEIDKYTWRDCGSSFLLSEINAAFLFSQLENAKDIISSRMKAWDLYYNGLKGLEEKGLLGLPFIPIGCEHNAHIFYIKLKDWNERDGLMAYLKEKGVNTVFHYIPLHNSPYGVNNCCFSGNDEYTTKESEKLLRLPMFYGISENQIMEVIKKIHEYFKSFANYI